MDLPNQRTRVGYLIENIDSSDKDVTTAVSHIRLDDGPSRMRINFKAAVAFLLPTDPVKRKRGSNKRSAAQISSTVAVQIGATNPEKAKKSVKFKPAVGKTGVEFRYYKSKEFRKLTSE